MKKSYDRILQISDDHKQITLPDSRFYRRNGDYYPSVTHVLSYYPKGPHFEDWLKKVGYASEYIVKKAAEEGTQTHNLCEDYLNGEECSFLNQYGNPAYSPHVWQMFLNFVNFWETVKPTLIETEVHLFSDKLKVAGTVDCIADYDGKLSVIDFKTSGRIKDKKDIPGYFIQTAAYAYMFWEQTGIVPEQLVIIMGVDNEKALVFTEPVKKWLPEFIQVREDFKKLKGY
jgi:genome maintenance exonuclease 1